MLPRSERPGAYVPPARPLGAGTQAASTPTPHRVERWIPGPIGIGRRPAAPRPAAPGAPPVLLDGGANPVLVVNTPKPDVGLVNTSSTPAPTLIRVDTPAQSTAVSDGGSSQLPFLVGAVFVAWLALRR